MNQSYLEKNELLREIPPFPETVSFPISMVCNAACKFCYKTLFPQSISYSPKFLPYETIKT